MIVPHTRLLVWVALVVVPFALLGALEPRAGWICLSAISGLMALAIVDAFRALRNSRGFQVALPSTVRMSRDRPAQIEVRLRNPSPTAREVRLALVLPREIDSPTEDARIILPAGSEWSRVQWPCVPRHRGSYTVSSACLETPSALGFWAARTAIQTASEVRVYPNLANERKNLAALFLKRGLFGLQAQRQVGKGREFEKLREYAPGDGFDEIHWKATARRGHPITKVFQIERTQEVYVILDISRLSARNVNPATPQRDTGQETEVGQEETLNQGTSTLERFITAALVLGLAAEQQGDLFGLLTFSDRIDRFLRARNGKSHFSACRDALYTLQPRIVSPDYEELSTFIRLRLRRRALLVFLTSLDDPVLARSFVRSLSLVCRQHLVLVNMIQPPGVEPVFSSPDVSSIDDLYQHLAGHLRWQKLRTLEKVLQRRGVQFSLLENERLSANLVSRYLRVKRRQLL